MNALEITARVNDCSHRLVLDTQSGTWTMEGYARAAWLPGVVVDAAQAMNAMETLTPFRAARFVYFYPSARQALAYARHCANPETGELARARVPLVMAYALDMASRAGLVVMDAQAWVVVDNARAA